MDLFYYIRTSIGVLILCLIAYGWLVEPLLIRLSRLEIVIPRLPRPLDGFAICHLSDLHIAEWGRPEEALRKVLSRVEADLFVITGDLLAGMGGIQGLERLVQCTSPKYGIYAVLGNGEHDPGMPGQAVAEDFRKLGISVLLNEHADVTVKGENLQLVGVDDPYIAHDDLDRALAGARPHGVRILLAHSPDIAMSLQPEQSIDLVLAGHTHGGQIKVPLLGVLWTHCRHGLRHMASGLFGPRALSDTAGHDVGVTQMYVSRGISGSGIRARFLCPPEVTVIVLRQQLSANC